MTNGISLLNEQEIEFLIKSLQVEKERYQQEKLAKRISGIRGERTAELVSGLLSSKDAYIRNIAIEILIDLGDYSLRILKEKIADPDRNIRKFVLDTLMHINSKQSCSIAVIALEDVDENVVEAALEVISCQKYKEAEEKLQKILQKTNSVWIINALVRTFAELELHHLGKAVEEKINSLNVTDVEKNILVNSYVRSLGNIGSYQDIDAIVNRYAKNYLIEDTNLILGLGNLVVKEDISKITEETKCEVGRLLKEHWDFRDSEQAITVITALVKLEMNFFLEDIEEIYSVHKGDDFFGETLYELILKLQDIPEDFICKILKSIEPELVVLGLRLVFTKQIPLDNCIVEALCDSDDREISEWVTRIVNNYNDRESIESSKNINTNEKQVIETLFNKLENQNASIRKAAVKELVLLSERINVKQLEEIVNRNVSERGLEALGLLFEIDESTAWDYIASEIDNINESVRAGFIDIVNNSDDDHFYRFMTTMINDPSHIVRRKAIKVLNKRIDHRSLTLLIELYYAEDVLINKMEILLNLYKFDSDVTITVLIHAACSTDTFTRMAAARALCFVNNIKTDDILKELMEDQEEEVRETARETLCKREETL